jgi:hypothetical protein
MLDLALEGTGGVLKLCAYRLRGIRHSGPEETQGRRTPYRPHGRHDFVLILAKISLPRDGWEKVLVLSRE